MMPFARAALLATPLALALLLVGCSSPSTPTSDLTDAGAPDAPAPDGGAPDASGVDLSDAMFDPERVLDVVIDMAPADWDALRFQARSVSQILGEGCQDGPKPSPYTYFPATVTVDGQKLAMSAVRKKGFLGSANLTKPSLKVSFDEYVPGREFSSLEGMTLNNSKQDPSLLKTCLAFKVFRDAGLPASRCNYARVTVNGAYLGLYAHVEPVGKRLLGRFFADNGGNLYEGQISDFRPGWSATYEKKTNEDDPDRSDIDALTAALGASDAELEATAGKVLDIDAFTKYWTLESLIAAWDGYAGNLNNHFVYHDPTSGKMWFLPWGPDMSFHNEDPFHPASRPQSVSAKGAVAYRLYSIPEGRARYVDTMKGLLTEAWKEGAILGEIDRVQALLSPHVGSDAPIFQAAGDAVRSFVNGRRAVIEGEIGSGPAAWSFPLPAVGCLPSVATVSGTFSTTWGTLGQNPFVNGKGTFELTVPPNPPQMGSPVGALAGYENGSTEKDQVIVVGSFPNGKTYALVLNVDPEVFAPGKDAPFDWQSVFGVALDVTQQGNPVTIGLFGAGTLHLDAASVAPGAAVSGSFSGELLGWPF